MRSANDATGGGRVITLYCEECGERFQAARHRKYCDTCGPIVVRRRMRERGFEARRFDPVGNGADYPLDKPARSCAKCKREFQLTARRRLLCQRVFPEEELEAMAAELLSSGLASQD